VTETALLVKMADFNVEEVLKKLTLADKVALLAGL
jgi:hypothetical protein